MLSFHRFCPALLGALVLAAAPAFAQTTPTCNGKVATIIGTDDGETIKGTKYPDVIWGGGGDDIISGGSGADTICGGDGSDYISGGNGPDWIDGGYGDDEISGGLGNDKLFGDLDSDLFWGNAGIDTCDGGVGQDGVPEMDCETMTNMWLQVKKVQLLDDDGTPLDGALFIPQGGTKKVALLATHGASGRFYTGLVGWIGWWGELKGLTTLALNRRDSIDYGPFEGGGATLFPDTVCDLKAGVDYLVSLGFEQVVIVGHSKGTQSAAVYPSYFKNCGADVAGSPDVNDPKVAGVANFGQVADGREAARFVPFASPVYGANRTLAKALVAQGLGAVLYPFPTQFPGTTVLNTPNSWLSYYDTTTLNVAEREAQKLIIPMLIIHVEGDGVTPVTWSDRMVQTLTDVGVDIAYGQPAYPFTDPTGFSQHSINARVVRDDAMNGFYDWMSVKFPGANQNATNLTIPALPDFSPALLPVPPSP